MPLTATALRLVGPQGTNRIMAGELSRLARRTMPGVRLEEPRKVGLGSLVYPWSTGLARTALCYHRTASRVLADLFVSTASRLEPLYDDLLAQMRAHPGGWYAAGTRISVRARAVEGFAAGERQIVGVVKNAIVEGAAAHGARLVVDPDGPDVHVHVRWHEGVLSVSLDLGGAMHQRGYRREAGPAPLRETLAAALVMLARHDSRREILLDPMAGSGTIAIEAALMARGAPLRVAPREPPCARTPGCTELLAPPLPPLFGDTVPLVVAGELDGKAIAVARDNVRRAGVGSDVKTQHGDFRALTPASVARLLRVPEDTPGVIVSNPPYGERMGGDVLALYDELRRWLGGFRGWRAAFLVANPEFERVLGVRPRIKKPLSASSLRGWFYLYDV